MYMKLQLISLQTGSLNS